MRKNDRDPLRELDWSKVYADVPGAVSDAVRVAALRIRQREQRRKRAARWIACAACLALAIGAVAYVLQSGQRAPDRVIPLAPEAVQLNDDSEVYASRVDGCYHVVPDCPKIAGEAVALRRVTAVEFEKTLCPYCGAGVAVDGT